MANRPSKRLAGRRAEQLAIAILLEEIVTDLNDVLRDREAWMLLDFRSPMPRLDLHLPSVKDETWLLANPKARTVYGFQMRHEELQELVSDIREQLDHQDAYLTLVAHKPFNKKAECKLQVHFRDLENAVLTLTTLHRGDRIKITEFLLPENLR